MNTTEFQQAIKALIEMRVDALRLCNYSTKEAEAQARSEVMAILKL